MKDEIDFLVATSAFGVGIDKNNVRTIIHLTVPETLERFYQEVGRAGRDGKNSNSILLYCENDYDIAENMHWNFYPKWKKRLKLFGAVQKYINHQTTRFLKMKAKHHLEMRKYERTNQ